MPFLKKDLLKSHYNWDSQRMMFMFTGQPSRRQFDRFNGEQVLFIINFYSSVSDKTSLKEGHEMEEMIFSKLPLDARSEISVFNWLRNVC
jgi:hypothetical protein